MRAEDIFAVTAAKAPAIHYLKATIACSNLAWLQPQFL